MMVNNGCENAQLVSALNSDDAGTQVRSKNQPVCKRSVADTPSQNIGNVFSNGFPADLVNAAFGQNLASSDVASKMTPVGTGSNWGLSECLKQCGIQPNGTYIRS